MTSKTPCGTGKTAPQKKEKQMFFVVYTSPSGWAKEAETLLQDGPFGTREAAERHATALGGGYIGYRIHSIRIVRKREGE